MRIAMIGSGYVGLVSGACFSEFGVEVVCVDIDKVKIEGLKDGKMPIYEPGLDALVASNVAAKRLSFTTDLPGAVKAADAVFIAVGTPVAPRRWPCRSLLCLRRRGRDRPRARRLYRRRHQVDRAGRHRPRGR